MWVAGLENQDESLFPNEKLNQVPAWLLDETGYPLQPIER